MKITAAVARTHGAPFTIEELDLDDLGHGEVRVRMVATGICHTDAIVRDGELGATHVVNSRTQDLASALHDIVGDAGIDYVVDTTGRPELLRAAADAIAVRGTVALVGAARPGT